MDAPQTLSSLFAVAEGGDRSARDRLFSTFYDELQRLAQRELGRGAGHVVTISATTLVHEAYEGLALRDGLAFPDKGRFMAYMARAMRGLIIDSARDKFAQKRGGEFHITRLDTHLAESLPEVPHRDRRPARRHRADGAARLGKGPVAALQLAGGRRLRPACDDRRNTGAESCIDHVALICSNHARASWVARCAGP